MDWIEVAARIVLCGTFAVAGLSKLRTRDAVAQSSVALGSPAAAAPAVAVVVPVLELLIAAGVLLTATVPVATALATALLVVFTAALVRVLARGEAVTCSCFGAAGAQTVSWWSVARNAALLGLVLSTVLVAGTVSLTDWAEERSVYEVWTLVLALSTAGLAVRVAQLLRERARTAAALAARIQRGQALPEIAVTGVGGVSVDLRDACSAPVTVLVFLSTTCGPCAELKPRLESWRRMAPPALRILTLSDAVPEAADDLHDLAFAAATRLGVPATPSAIRLDEHGTVTHEFVAGAAAIEALITASAS